MTEDIIFYYVDVLSPSDESLVGRSPTFSTADDARAFAAKIPAFDIIKIVSRAYSWQRADCFTKYLIVKKRRQAIAHNALALANGQT